MSPKTEELLERTFLFGVDTLLFLSKLPNSKVYLINLTLERNKYYIGHIPYIILHNYVLRSR
jgi:hypothetical protein